jgi:hypothetical protein
VSGFFASLLEQAARGGEVFPRPRARFEAENEADSVISEQPMERVLLPPRAAAQEVSVPAPERSAATVLAERPASERPRTVEVEERIERVERIEGRELRETPIPEPRELLRETRESHEAHERVLHTSERIVVVRERSEKETLRIESPSVPPVPKASKAEERRPAEKTPRANVPAVAQRETAEAAIERQPSSPNIRIEIGRIEVRAREMPAPASEIRPALDLDSYLRDRGGRR